VAGEELEGRWSTGFADVGAAMAEWRREHPRATLSEIEDALDERLAGMRSQMLVDTVMTSRAASFAGARGTERPRCPGCEGSLLSRGEVERTLLTTRGQEVHLRRSYAECPSCGLQFFPPR
jgi:YgiT-type zinc finger domain-containing protein